MKGLITKKHIVQIYRAFGIKIALKVLFSTRPVALNTLMGV
jgi:hypothetical protein